jgi:hypothetical protein
MAATEYHFIDRWRVRGGVEEVAAIIGDAPDWARWWASTYREVTVTTHGDERRVGQEGDVRAAAWLPYGIRFHYRITESWHPRGFALDATGDLTGRGVWTFEEVDGFTLATFDWRVRTDKPLLRHLSWLLKPLFRSNHAWTMRQGERSLELELARRRAATAEAAALIPPPPGPFRWRPIVLAGLAGLAAASCILASRHLGRPLRVSHSAFIARPVHDVFDFVTRVENDLAWQPEIEQVTVTSTGPLRAGSTFREVRTTLGQRFVWDMLITTLEPDRRICIESVSGATPYRGCREFVTVPGGTRVTETSEAWLPSWLRPFQPLLGRAARAPVARAYARLAAILEVAPPR